MADKLRDRTLESSIINSSEERAIEQRVDFELNEMQFKMIKLGGITNILSGIFVIWILNGHAKFSVLVAWFLALVVGNLVNIAFSYIYRYSNVQPDQIKPWLAIYHSILIILCLTWGSIGVLFTSGDIHYQLYVIAFLLAVLIGFGFGTISDFVASSISIVCLLTPYIAYHLYLGIHAQMTLGSDPDLNIGFSSMLFILGLFLLGTCYIGYRLIKSSSKLSFVNVALSKKLENMNKFLEQRVKERTIELEKSLNMVTYQATHDLLTDLPNQRLLLEYLQSAIKVANENGHSFAVLFFSLNEIEKINDGLGYQAGDLVIQTIAQRFQKTLNKATANSLYNTHYTVTLSRKDVFVILLDPVMKAEDIENAEILFSVLEDPIYTGNQAVKLTASIGVSLYPRDGRDIQSLLMNSDAAMLRAKQIGGNNLNIYHAEINADISKQLEIERNLHNAVKNNEFILQYQPFVDLKTGEIVGAEALVRWNSPVLGFIPPNDFIALAEANGMIIPIGEWVLRNACLQAKTWQDKGYMGVRVAINLSAKQLHKKNIVQAVVEILKETGVTPDMIELELTESEAFQEAVVPILQQFKEMGFHLSIDDFGTGYSGLSNLKQFSIDTLKIDKSFVRDVDVSEDSQAIVSNTIALAKKINVTILAEGVETKEQLEFLKEHGCDLIQGYFFSPPINAEAFTKLLRSKTQFVT